MPSFSKFCLCTNDHKTGALPVLWTMFIIIVALILPVLSFGADIWIYVEGNSVAHKIFWLSRQPKLTKATSSDVDSLDKSLMKDEVQSDIQKRQIQLPPTEQTKIKFTRLPNSINLTSLIPTDSPTTFPPNTTVFQNSTFFNDTIITTTNYIMPLTTPAYSIENSKKSDHKKL